MDAIGERIGQILADAQHREEDESDQRRSDRRGKAQGFDQRDRKQHAEHAREEVREEPKAIGQRRVLDPLHATLRIGDVDQDALHSCLLDLGDPTFRERVGVNARYVLQERVGRVQASDRHIGDVRSGDPGNVFIGRLSAKLAAHRVREGDLPQDDVVPRLTALGFPLGQAACDPGQAARRIDERAPKGSRFPPARISCVGPKPHEERDGSAEQRRRQRRFLDRGHHVECRHRHVPHEQDRERLPNLDNDLPKTWPRADYHINYALNLLAIVIRSACS